MITAVVFDLGGVLASPPSLLSALAERMGAPRSRVVENYWTGRAAYDAGGSVEEYWGTLVAASGGTAGSDQLEELALLDASVWSELRPSAWQVLRDCRAAGVIVAILSNSPHAMQTVADRSEWRSDVDHLFVSATLGMMKPDPPIYRAVETALDLTGERIAFIDDKQANVDGALALGWQAHVWTDDADTRDWLVGLGVLES